MPDTKAVERAFWALREGRQAVQLADGGQGRAAAGQDLVWIGLVAYIPHQPVIRCVEQIVQGNGEFHRAQIGGEMSAGLTDGLDQVGAQIRRHRSQRRFGQQAQRFRGIDLRQQRGKWAHGTWRR